MLKIKKIFALLMIFHGCSFSLLNAMEEPEQTEITDTFGYITLPGMNGCGGDDFRHNGLIYSPSKSCETLDSGFYIDLGQGNCIKHFKEQLKNQPWEYNSTLGNNNIPPKKNLVFGFSQGTATVINWLAQKKLEKQNKKVAGLVLQAVLGNGNNAILHNAERIGIVRPLTYLPFARFWIPLIAKALHPTYNPWGKQALSSAKKLSPNIPVIIMHDIYDPETHINDARKLYCTLVNNRKTNNVYLIETDFGGHVNLIHKWRNERKAEREQKAKIVSIINTFYKKFGFNYEKDSLADDEDELKTYQPSINEVHQKIKASSNSSRYIRNTIDTISGGVLLGTLAYYGYNFWHKS